MTGSPVLAGDTIYTGVSASGAGGPNATFRGAIVALNAQTGRLLWRSYSVPDNGGVPGGYAGATMFSPPAVSLRAGLVYGTFGQPYTDPGERQGVPRRTRRLLRRVRAARIVPAIGRGVRSEDRRTALVVSGAGPRPVAARVRQSAAIVTWCAPEADTENGISAARARTSCA